MYMLFLHEHVVCYRFLLGTRANVEKYAVLLFCISYFLLVPAHPGSLEQRVVKRLLMLL